MTVKASEVINIFEELNLNYGDKGIDKDGDHIFVTGFPSEVYRNHKGKEGFICQFQLLEHRDGTGKDDDLVDRLTSELINVDRDNESDEFDRIMRELKEAKEGKKGSSEREYDMIAVYIDRLNTGDLSRDDQLKIINEVNSTIKCARLALDSADDVIFYYQLILEDGSFTSSQFKRMISVTMSAVDRFASLANEIS